MCKQLNATYGASIGYKKDNNVWKKHDGSEIPEDFTLDWMTGYRTTGNYMSLECWAQGTDVQDKWFGQLYKSSDDKPFICQYI